VKQSGLRKIKRPFSRQSVMQVTARPLLKSQSFILYARALARGVWRRFVARSRLPIWRRISQIFFLLLFLALLIFTSLRPSPGATGDIHLRAPVRLFFELDPLVAIVNALASHALYRC
jgi:hypothetical protein